ncbi:hypothetical protein Pcinc_010733 [Petrolisthes cinctipes]|uniref:Uncharacterized protein n=1 Tax=Petrolisthes cinctipes TaxID=88211 RepID=A0AAE1G4F1_PETCI|nr:hypothetical protein Pcinc_010733 [Petrolisthes cinctipes]
MDGGLAQDESVDAITLCTTNVDPMTKSDVDEADEGASFPSHHDSLSNNKEDEDSDGGKEEVQEKIHNEIFEGSGDEDEELEAIRDIFSCDIDYGEFEHYEYCEECADEEEKEDYDEEEKEDYDEEEKEDCDEESEEDYEEKYDDEEEENYEVEEENKVEEKEVEEEN